MSVQVLLASDIEPEAIERARIRQLTRPLRVPDNTMVEKYKSFYMLSNPSK